MQEAGFTEQEKRRSHHSLNIIRHSIKEIHVKKQSFLLIQREIITIGILHNLGEKKVIRDQTFSMNELLTFKTCLK